MPTDAVQPEPIWRTTASGWFDPDTEAVLLNWIKGDVTALFRGVRKNVVECMVCKVGVDVVLAQPVCFN